jgi:hypothetical protein
MSDAGEKLLISRQSAEVHHVLLRLPQGANTKSVGGQEVCRGMLSPTVAGLPPRQVPTSVVHRACEDDVVVRNRQNLPGLSGESAIFGHFKSEFAMENRNLAAHWRRRPRLISTTEVLRPAPNAADNGWELKSLMISHASVINDIDMSSQLRR